ncbi:MAG TPA: glycosyltransferase family 2 protein [Capsulimonadaceae bacterium]|nr:glycosyltransferase family 2 protein [Capsulimonadaceae bacterium]
MLISILVPAYNEEDTIVESLKRLCAVDFGRHKVEVIVVDDASTDRTAELVESFDCEMRLFRHEKNQGKGAAIRTALKEANGDIVVIHDADLEYDAADIPALIAPIAAGDAPASFGTRFALGARARGMKLPNLIANKLLAWAASLLFFKKISDEATCYKAVRTELLRGMNLQCQRFEFCPEVTAKLMRGGHVIAEVPVRYQARTVAEGKKIHWYDGLEAIWTLVKYRFVK